MTLPQLYSNVSLKSYDYIHYQHDGRPEGCGAASPFVMGLNGLVSRNVAGYTKNFTLRGEWKEDELEEYAKVGRVPDGTMLLNCLIRLAVDKMEWLNTFRWDLNTKMMPALWHSLARRPALTQLTVKFPLTRVPRPTLIVPPMANLTILKITDIDPLCYPDDISMLIFGSKELQELILHWSPRMRNAREPSVSLNSYFGKVIAAKHRLTIKSLALHNLYARSEGNFGAMFDWTKWQELTLINSTGGLGEDGGTMFVDHDWQLNKPDPVPNLKMLRTDKISMGQCEILAKYSGLEMFYLVSAQTHSDNRINGTSKLIQNNGGIPTPTLSSPPTPHEIPALSLAKDYINNLCNFHGSTLRHLLLMPQWRLSAEDLARIIRSCPNLEQMGVGFDVTAFEFVRLMVPILQKLSAFRILDSPENPAFRDKMHQLDTGKHCAAMENEMSKLQWSSMKWVGLSDYVFEISDPIAVEQNGHGEKQEFRRKVRMINRECVKHVEIWKMDSKDI